MGDRLAAQATRALGLAALVTGTGPANPEPALNQLLRYIGVLDRDTRAAVNSPLLERLPWDGGAVQAPAPPRPEGIEGMWPQPPVFHPDIYPVVLSLDDDENNDHLRSNVLRYIGQVLALTPTAAWRSRVGPRVKPLDDRMFSAILTETSLAQHLRDTLSEDDRARFAAHLKGDPDSYTKVDYSGVQPGPALPWVTLAPSVTLFERAADGRLVPRAIRVRDAIFTPDDGAAWVLARYQVLSAVHVQHTVIVHPRLHFPGDIINAMSKTLLPAGHLLSRLILPHTRFTLGLDRAVTHHQRSVLYNSQRELYTPLPLTTEGICAAVSLGRGGMEGNTSYPTYDFWGIPCDQRTAFGRYCQQWQDAFERFATAIARLIPANDPCVVAWADAIAAWVPGFPDGAAIFKEGALGRAVGRYLASVTVLHSADHHSYAMIPIEYLPMRLRVPSPDVQRPTAVDLDALVSPEDFFRHVLCHRMFFTPVIIESLDEVRYTFQSPEARQAARAFREERARLDQRWMGSGFPASAEIASSIQY